MNLASNYVYKLFLGVNNFDRNLPREMSIAANAGHLPHLLKDRKWGFVSFVRPVWVCMVNRTEQLVFSINMFNIMIKITPQKFHPNNP